VREWSDCWRSTQIQPYEPENTVGSSDKTWVVAFLSLSLLFGCQKHSNFAPVVDAWHTNSAAHSGHKVQKGETLYSIAWGYGLDYRELARINHIAKPYTLHLGQLLHFKSIRSHSYKAAKYKKSLKFHAKQPKRLKMLGNKAVRPHQTTYPKFNTVTHWDWPANGKLVNTFSLLKGQKGIDIVARYGSPVLACAQGKVVYAGSGLMGYGKLLIIKHNTEYLSAYAHNSKLDVREGNWVKAGQKIAEIGSTGTNIDKVHFEIRRAGKPVNPLKYLPKRS